MKAAFLSATLATVLLMRRHPAVAPTRDRECDTLSPLLLLAPCAGLSLVLTLELNLLEVLRAAGGRRRRAAAVVRRRRSAP